MNDGGGQGGETNVSPAELLDALGDEHVRTILCTCRKEPTTANGLAECCGVSPSTVYRRLDRLTDLGLIERADPALAAGSQRYRTTFDTARVALDDGGWTMDLESGTGATAADGDGSDLEVQIERATARSEQDRVELSVSLTREDVMRLFDQ